MLGGVAFESARGGERPRAAGKPAGPSADVVPAQCRRRAKLFQSGEGGRGVPGAMAVTWVVEDVRWTDLIVGVGVFAPPLPSAFGGDSRGRATVERAKGKQSESCTPEGEGMEK